MRCIIFYRTLRKKGAYVRKPRLGQNTAYLIFTPYTPSFFPKGREYPIIDKFGLTVLLISKSNSTIVFSSLQVFFLQMPSSLQYSLCLHTLSSEFVPLFIQTRTPTATKLTINTNLMLELRNFLLFQRKTENYS